ncbi:cysteine-rich venom protein TEL1-like [Eleutherodactylus coqui]|uniref:cysteine-rich venom protein TEL1-like n=1 Tax=Eleutherodactylus coqui TaxID=57060 RepID=UPI003462C35C
MKLLLAELLMLALIQGEIVATFSFKNKDGRNAIISNVLLRSEEVPENVPEPLVAYLGNVKKKKSIRKRSAGRPVNIDGQIVESMMNTPLSSLSTDLPDVQKEILESHNKYRRQASPNASNMLKMVWNAEAAKTALAWAKKCQPGHSPSSQRVITNFKCGENIFTFGWKVPWCVVSDSWYSEYIDFKYGIGNITDEEIGHFTQLMWATSHAVGCAVWQCPSSFVYVCHYGPAGNKGGRSKPWKEGKPCGDCPNACDNNLCSKSFYNEY